jgi:crotonobetainyl-CoA:carnitine CoA-transferase CaiB-like acyl-CoA transferase
MFNPRTRATVARAAAAPHRDDARRRDRDRDRDATAARDLKDRGQDIVRQALSDLRVVEIGTGVAAGWCGKAFADLGADVVKVEPPDGDPLRADAGMFAHLHTNKRSAVVEVAPAAAASLVALLDGVDLVIEAPGFGSLADWGVDRADLLAERGA